MRYLLLILPLMLVACPKPKINTVFIPSVVSPTMDVDKIVPKPVEPPELKKMCAKENTFDPKPISDESLPGKGGFMVSDCFFATTTYDKAKLKALDIELKAYKELRVQERKQFQLTEQAYQKHLTDLAKRNTKASWWDRSKFYIGLTLGILTSIAITLTAGKMAKNLKDK